MLVLSQCLRFFHAVHVSDLFTHVGDFLVWILNWFLFFTELQIWTLYMNTVSFQKDPGILFWLTHPVFWVLGCLGGVLSCWRLSCAETYCTVPFCFIHPMVGTTSSALLFFPPFRTASFHLHKNSWWVAIAQTLLWAVGGTDQGNGWDGVPVPHHLQRRTLEHLTLSPIGP